MGCDSCSFKKVQSENSDILSFNIFGSQTTYDWLKDLPEPLGEFPVVEVKFKDNKKEFFRNAYGLNLTYDDLVTVQVSKGFDVGIVSLKGVLAEKQFLKKAAQPNPEILNIIYRKATGVDITSWLKGKALEKATLIKSRLIAMSMNLDMKISDVEFQGDSKKAMFYYTAAGRVDFRDLVKQLSNEFSVRVEMKQIGLRQEAAKIGGIGSCGKELCCSTWRTELPSVSMSAIQAQQLPPSAEKYIGQCGKLKCCLMYELDTYLEAKADFPKELLELETQKGTAHPIKTDLLKKTVWYIFRNGDPSEPQIEISLERVKEIIQLNKRGKKAESLEPETSKPSIIIKKKGLSYQ